MPRPLFMIESIAHRRSQFTDAGLQFSNWHDDPSVYTETIERIGRSKRYRPAFAFNDAMLRHVLALKAWRFVHGKTPMPPTLDYKFLDAACDFHARTTNILALKQANTRCGTYMSWLGAVAWKAWRLGYFDSEIAEELAVPQRTVMNVIKSLVKVARDLGFPTYDVPGPRTGKKGGGPPRRPMDVARALELWDAGQPTTEIMAALGETRCRVLQALKENGRDVKILRHLPYVCSPEASARKADAMRAQRANPEYEGKRKAAQMAALKRDWSDPEKRKLMLAKMSACHTARRIGTKKAEAAAPAVNQRPA